MKSKEQTQADFGDLYKAYRQIVATALKTFYDEQKSYRYRFGKGTEAAVVNDYLREEARKALGDNGRVKIIEKRRSMLICMDGYAIKLKKFDARLRTRNIPTAAVNRFNNQQAQLEGMPGEPTNLFLGYQRNDVEITTSPIYFVCPNGKEIEWEWHLLEGDVDLSGIAPTPQPPATPPMLPISEPVVAPPPRVKPKVAEGEASEDGKASSDEKD